LWFPQLLLPYVHFVRAVFINTHVCNLIICKCPMEGMYWNYRFHSYKLIIIFYFNTYWRLILFDNLTAGFSDAFYIYIYSLSTLSCGRRNVAPQVGSMLTGRWA
jgi:hypothetical protein